MRIDVLTLFPETFSGPLEASILGRALREGIAEVHLHNIRDYAHDKHQMVDDYAYGGGPGMVMKPEPLAASIEAVRSMVEPQGRVVLMTPQGRVFNQAVVDELAAEERLILLCGHYKGVDERVRQKYITHEISIGDYVLSGGELGAAVLTDAIIRILPGVLNDESSALTDSFQDGLLAPPVYTRPAEYEGMGVPDILLSGDTPRIEHWRFEQAIERTRKRRPDV